MLVLTLIRFVVFALFVLSAAVTIGSWALQTRRINPFGRTGQALRRFSDPILGPIESWQLQRGGNPQNAGWWLLGLAVVGGIITIPLAEWIIVQMVRVAGAASAGPRSVFRLGVYYAGQLLLIALLVRVVASWFGQGRYNPWVRWTYTLTDWIVEPLRKIIPPFGMIDIVPLVAWFGLQVLLGLVMSVL